jgi:hypothetical protein
MAGRGFANDVWLKREGFYTTAKTAWYYLLNHDSVVLFT